jgi:hypothetical protein
MKTELHDTSPVDEFCSLLQTIPGGRTAVLKVSIGPVLRKQANIGNDSHCVLWASMFRYSVNLYGK